MAGVMCPHCGKEIFKRRASVKGAIMDAIREHGPIRIPELARLVYDDPYAASESAASNLKVHISQINRGGRVILHIGNGCRAEGYVLADRL